MATRARIGLQLKDGSILSVYHHWDGYPQWLGRILETHYDNRSKVSELIDGGDMSSCWTKDRWTGKQVAPYVIEQKEAKQYGPQYYSQRGEDCPPKLDKNLDEFLSDGEEYAYVYSSYTGWKAYDTKSWSDTFKQQVDIPCGELAV